MKIEMLRKNQIVLNKVNGEDYQVIDNDGRAMQMAHDECGALIFDKDKNPTLVAGSEIRITEKNALAFRLKYDPNVEPVPDITEYDLKDGIILKSGKPLTQQGDIYVTSILGAIRGNLILTVKRTPRSDENYSRAFIYNLVNDRFVPVCSHLYPNGNVIPLITKEDSIILYGYEVVSETVKDQDGTDETVNFLKSSELLRVTITQKGRNIKADFLPLNALLLTEFVEVKNSPYCIAEIIARTKGDERELVPVSPDAYSYFVYDRNNRTDYESVVFTLEEKLKKVTTSGAYDATLAIQTDNSVTLLNVGEPEKKVTINGVSLLAGYDYLIDVTMDETNHVGRYAFANEAYDIKTIVSKKTRDRGFIVTVE